jgi:hypothetical protein
VGHLHHTDSGTEEALDSGDKLLDQGVHFRLGTDGFDEDIASEFVNEEQVTDITTNSKASNGRTQVEVNASKGTGGRASAR